MSLIIDGYNLLYVAGICGDDERGRAPRRPPTRAEDREVRRPTTGLQRSRDTLLRFLANTLPASELSRTTVVFDAAEAPPGLPSEAVFEQMRILFAANYDDADALIEELIAADHAPRSLTVVSSDHRIQRAARRRRAAYFDSDVWFALQVRARRRRQTLKPPVVRPAGPLTTDEVDFWLEEFEIDVDLTFDNPAAEPRRVSPGSSDGASTDKPRKPARKRKSKKKPPPSGEKLSLENPFPPGYADDVLREFGLDQPPPDQGP
ncbi:MAG: NYN domain-containing protein [Planctomycetales bacterium]|nr:NYN domain-containing protein [Planctomycetales bacterium]